jgi:hypothetical protein
MKLCINIRLNQPCCSAQVNLSMLTKLFIVTRWYSSVDLQQFLHLFRFRLTRLAIAALYFYQLLEAQSQQLTRGSVD